jgi:hypothetical protein
MSMKQSQSQVQVERGVSCLNCEAVVTLTIVRDDEVID